MTSVMGRLIEDDGQFTDAAAAAAAATTASMGNSTEAAIAISG